MTKAEHTPIKGRFRIPGFAGTHSRDRSHDIVITTGKYQGVIKAYRYHPDDTLPNEDEVKDAR